MLPENSTVMQPISLVLPQYSHKPYSHVTSLPDCRAIPHPVVEKPTMYNTDDNNTMQADIHTEILAVTLVPKVNSVSRNSSILYRNRWSCFSRSILSFITLISVIFFSCRCGCQINLFVVCLLH